MKLIDILVQELPKRGGWPARTACITQDNDGSLCLWKYNNVKCVGDSWCHPSGFGMVDYHCRDRAVAKSDDYSESIITREQYEAALKQSVWGGTGLPPVGVECEWQDKNTKQWIQVLVVYASEWVTVIRENKSVDPVELAIENYGDDARRQFRPIRSETERKRELIISQIETVFKNCPCDDQVSISIYDAIAAGRITGVKLSD